MTPTSSLTPSSFTPQSSSILGESELKILVLDDDEALLRLLRLLLDAEGFHVVTARNGIEGLERIEAEPDIDAIVLDLEMPQMDGRGFFRELRARGNDTPVVVLSAYGARSALRELQADAGLDKPFDPERLVSIIRKLTATPVQDP